MNGGTGAVSTWPEQSVLTKRILIDTFGAVENLPSRAFTYIS